MKLIILALLSIVSLCLCAQITNLPGLSSQPTFKQYSGYQTVDKSNGRAIFYWFVESKSNPAVDPVVLWLTGVWICNIYFI